MKILIAIGLLKTGGAERVLSLLANEWASVGVHVSVMVIGNSGEVPAFSIAPGVDVTFLNLQGKSDSALGGLLRNIGRIVTLRNAIREAKPDVIISFLDLTNVRCLLATWGLRIPIIVSEGTDPASRNIGRIWELLRRITYPKADAVVVQGQRIKNYFSQAVQRETHIIPNPVVLPEEVRDVRADLNRPGSVKNIVALGSLRKEKGFDILIQAFADIAGKHPNWNLTIWGEGADRQKLEALSARLGIDERVRLPGNTREPFLRLAEADLFVLSSRVEGSPNALTEAMSMGLPVIATDVGAISEVVQDGVDGIIVPSGKPEALSFAMEKLMVDQPERVRLGANAVAVVERFGLKRVIAMWDDLIEIVIRRTSNGAR